MRKENYFGLLAGVIAVISSITLNGQTPLEDVACGTGKLWYVYDQSVVVVEDSNSPYQLSAARTASKYTRLQDLELCNGSVILGAICAVPDASNADTPAIPSGSGAFVQLGYYVNNQPFSSLVIVECSE
jgi:hypothetical protein